MTQSFDPRTGRSSAERIEAFSLALRSANTKAERRSVIDGFLNNPRQASRDGSFGQWVKQFRGESEEMITTRAIGTDASGADLVQPQWNNDLIIKLLSFDEVVSAMELWRSPTGGPATRSLVDVPAGASAVTENPTSGLTDATLTFEQQFFGEPALYSAGIGVSTALYQDAANQEIVPPNGSGLPGLRFDPSATVTSSGNIEEGITRTIAESVARGYVPAAINSLYSATWTNAVTLGAATAVKLGSGVSTELSSKTISIPITAPKIVASLDPAYRALPDTAWWVSPAALEGLQAQVDANGRPLMRGMELLNFPVCVSGSLTAHDATASTQSGVCFGSMSAAMTNRVANDISVLKSFELRADKGEVWVQAWIRAQAAQRDSGALVSTVYAGT
jgi:hypothetical protein